jgi:hypothetical protein
MAFTQAGIHSMLNFVRGSTGPQITHVALHNGTNVTTSGTALELSTVGNIYARQPVSFPAASGGKSVETTAVAFTVPINSTVAAVSFWNSSATDGVCLAYTTVPDEVYAAQGSYTITASTLAITSTT